MNKTLHLLVSSIVILACISLTEAQQPTKAYRIGMLATGSAATHKSRIDAFRQGLQELGYIEGKNVVLELRYAEGKRERYAEFAAEMARLKPDVIVVGSVSFTAATKQATSTIPIVVGGAGDLVGSGAGRQPGSPGRKYQRLHRYCPGPQWQAVGAT